MTNKKVGLYGGTFDPIHIGHIITTRFVLEHRGLDEIIFIPCNISPMKTDIESTSAEHRVNMLRLAIEGLPKFSVSDYEIKKGDVSFTYDTLCEMKKHYNSIELIIGFDNLLVFDKWHKPDEIFELANVVVMRRLDENEVNKTHKYFDKAIILDTPAIDISSSEIRDRIKNKLPVDYLVPDKVKNYIYRNELYT